MLCVFAWVVGETSLPWSCKHPTDSQLISWGNICCENLKRLEMQVSNSWTPAMRIDQGEVSCVPPSVPVLRFWVPTAMSKNTSPPHKHAGAGVSGLGWRRVDPRIAPQLCRKHADIPPKLVHGRLLESHRRWDELNFFPGKFRLWAASAVRVRGYSINYSLQTRNSTLLFRNVLRVLVSLKADRIQRLNKR